MKKLLLTLLSILVLSSVILPVALYYYKFGFGLWDKNEDWALFGSYIGGVVGPIITTISLLFLAYQIHLQTKQRSEEKKLHVCSECEMDISKYVPRIKEFIEREDNKNGVEFVLLEYKSFFEKGEIDNAQEIIRKQVSDNISIWSMWVHIDSCLRTLQRLKMYKFKRMRTLLLSEIEIDHLVILEGVRERMVDNGTPTCLFPMEA